MILPFSILFFFVDFFGGAKLAGKNHGIRSVGPRGYLVGWFFSAKFVLQVEEWSVFELGSVDQFLLVWKKTTNVEPMLKDKSNCCNLWKKRRTIFLFSEYCIYIYILHIHIIFIPKELHCPPQCPSQNCFFVESWQLYQSFPKLLFGWSSWQLPRVKPPKSNLVHCNCSAL